MNREELQRIIGRLRFGDPEQIRLKRLLEEGEAGSGAERIGAWLHDSLLRVGGCPPEALLQWARSLRPEDRSEARLMVEGLRAVVLAMDVFLEQAGRESAADTENAPPAP